jgi:hypothetical protein
VGGVCGGIYFVTSVMNHVTVKIRRSVREVASVYNCIDLVFEEHVNVIYIIRKKI